MYAFILVVTISLMSAESAPSRSFVLTSDDQYSPPVCAMRAQAAADRMGELLSAVEGTKVEIQHSCVLLETRKI